MFPTLHNFAVHVDYLHPISENPLLIKEKGGVPPSPFNRMTEHLF
jgi:hypothetical protein